MFSYCLPMLLAYQIFSLCLHYKKNTLSNVSLFANWLSFYTFSFDQISFGYICKVILFFLPWQSFQFLFSLQFKFILLYYTFTFCQISFGYIYEAIFFLFTPAMFSISFLIKKKLNLNWGHTQFKFNFLFYTLLFSNLFWLHL